MSISQVSYITVFVPIAAHASISAHPSNFEIISHKLVNHILLSISQDGLDVYLWGFGVWFLQKLLK